MESIVDDTVGVESCRALLGKQNRRISGRITLRTEKRHTLTAPPDEMRLQFKDRIPPLLAEVCQRNAATSANKQQEAPIRMG